MAAGELLHPRDLEVGDVVQAKDPSDVWFNAVVIEKRGRGARATVEVHYTGFPDSHNETIGAGQQRLRIPISQKELKRE